MICDGRDPPWINNEITQLIEKKKQFFKGFIRSNKSLLYSNQFFNAPEITRLPD